MPSESILMRRICVPRRAQGSLSSGTGTRARRSCRTYRSRFAVNSTKTLRHPFSAPTPPPSASPAALRTPTADQRDRQSKKFVATSRPSFSRERENVGVQLVSATDAPGRGLSPVTRDTLVCMALEFHLKNPTLLKYRDATQTRGVQSRESVTSELRLLSYTRSQNDFGYDF